MKHLKIFEDFEAQGTIYPEVQKMIDENQFLKGKIQASKDTVYESGDFILLLGDLSHITDAHVDETIPGSKFNKGLDLKRAIINLVTNNKPTQMTTGFGPSEKEVSNPNEAQKFKWLGLDSKTDVGIENVHKSEPNSEEFKSMNVYTYKDSRGNEFKIKVKDREGEKTTFLSFIGAKLGTIGDKIVLSVMTAFPGKNAVSIANRNDFMKDGYYFTTQNKEVIEKSTGSVGESFKRIKKFGNYIKESNGMSIGDRFKELVFDSDDLPQELKFEDMVELNNIAGQLREEYPGTFIECDFMRIGDKFRIFLRCYDSQEAMDDRDLNDETTEIEIHVPEDREEW